MSESAFQSTAGVLPLLIDIRKLAVLLNRSVASQERDQSAGRLPKPVRLGGSRQWRRAEIVAWVEAGCPVPDAS